MHVHGRLLGGRINTVICMPDTSGSILRPRQKCLHLPIDYHHLGLINCHHYTRSKQLEKKVTVSNNKSHTQDPQLSHMRALLRLEDCGHKIPDHHGSYRRLFDKPL